MTKLVPGRSEENFRLDQSAHRRFETPGLSLAQCFLVGGEPAGHPDLEPIVRRFGQYRDRRGPGAFQVGLATAAPRNGAYGSCSGNSHSCTGSIRARPGRRTPGSSLPALPRSTVRPKPWQATAMADATFRGIVG